jgi:hypothetical protein
VYPTFCLLRHVLAWVRLPCLCHSVVVLSIGMEDEQLASTFTSALRRIGFSVTGPLPPSRSCVCHGRIRYSAGGRSQAFTPLCLFPLALCLPAWLVARPVPMSFGAAIQTHQSHWAGQGGLGSFTSARSVPACLCRPRSLVSR